MNNHYRTNTSQEGGAVTSFQSEIVFMGRTNLMYNTAIRGGAIAATQSKLYMYGDIIQFLITQHQCLVEASMPARANSTSRKMSTLVETMQMIEVEVFMPSVQLQD